VAYRLYVPKDWAEDNERGCKAGVPEEIGFKTKPEIALEQIRWACETDLPGDLVVIDAGYGNASQLRAGITELGKLYVAGIQSQTLVSKPSPRRGRRDASNSISVRSLPSGCVRRRGTRSSGEKAPMRDYRRDDAECPCHRDPDDLAYGHVDQGVSGSNPLSCTAYLALLCKTGAVVLGLLVRARCLATRR
jgi:hypothetical protein